jgi:hypothetical protein
MKISAADEEEAAARDAGCEDIATKVHPLKLFDPTVSAEDVLSQVASILPCLSPLERRGWISTDMFTTLSTKLTRL